MAPANEIPGLNVGAGTSSGSVSPALLRADAVKVAELRGAPGASERPGKGDIFTLRKGGHFYFAMAAADLTKPPNWPLHSDLCGDTMFQTRKTE